MKDDTGDLFQNVAVKTYITEKMLPLNSKSPALAALFEEPCSERLNEYLQSQTEHLQRD